jgi:hypothetical protein
VEQGKLPKPVHIDSLALWDRLALELAFEQLTSDNDRPNSFDVIISSVRK